MEHITPYFEWITKFDAWTRRADKPRVYAFVSGAAFNLSVLSVIPFAIALWLWLYSAVAFQITDLHILGFFYFLGPILAMGVLIMGIYFYCARLFQQNGLRHETKLWKWWWSGHSTMIAAVVITVFAALGIWVLFNDIASATQTLDHWVNNFELFLLSTFAILLIVPIALPAISVTASILSVVLFRHGEKLGP